jgi:hypothetical protein
LRKLFKNQGYHLLIWVILGGVLYFESRQFVDGKSGLVWGWSGFTWVVFSWVLAALHQGWIWFFWRMELYKKAISGRFGDRGFAMFRVGFGMLILTRLFTVIPISMATPDSLSMPHWLSLGFIVITTPFIIWGMYCVVAYFGMTRAFGADHFFESYRGGTLERRGIFKYIPNSMYTVVLLALYHPGFLLNSRLGLITALAHHLFVWTHYFCTERPDMKEIYSPQAKSPS